MGAKKGDGDDRPVDRLRKAAQEGRDDLNERLREEAARLERERSALKRASGRDRRLGSPLEREVSQRAAASLAADAEATLARLSAELESEIASRAEAATRSLRDDLDARMGAAVARATEGLREDLEREIRRAEASGERAEAAERAAGDRVERVLHEVEVALLARLAEKIEESRESLLRESATLAERLQGELAERLMAAETRLAEGTAAAQAQAEGASMSSEERIASLAERSFLERSRALENRLSGRMDAYGTEIRERLDAGLATAKAQAQEAVDGVIADARGELASRLERSEATIDERLAKVDRDLRERIEAEAERSRREVMATLERLREEVAAEVGERLRADSETLRTEAEAAIGSAGAAAREDLAGARDRMRTELVEGADRELAERIERQWVAQNRRVAAHLNEVAEVHSERLAATVGEGEERLSAYVEKHLTRAARRQELKLVREEREKRIRAAEKRVEREGQKIVATARSEAEKAQMATERQIRARAEEVAREAAGAGAEAAMASAAESIRADIEQLVAEARDELRAASERLAEAERRASAETLAIAHRTEARAEAAEARVLAAADVASAEAARNIWSTGDAVWRRIESQSKAQATRRQLESLLDRFQEADRRLRVKEARLRAAAARVAELPPEASRTA